MKGNDLFLSFSFADDELTERAHKTMQGEHKYKKIAAWKRWSTVAACVCLVLAGALLFPLFEKPPVVDFIDHTVAPWENLWVPDSDAWVGNGETEDAGADIPPPVSAYGPDYMIVVAKVIEVLPSVYVDAPSSPYINTFERQYHVVKLQVLEAIRGENMPSEIYLRLNANLDPSLDEYDSLVIGGLRQVGFENYGMINMDQKRAEKFSFLFECWNYENQGAILPFKDGVLCLEHWKKDGWLSFRTDWDWEDFREQVSSSSGWGSDYFPAWEGCTVEDTVQSIQEMLKRWAHIRAKSVRYEETFATEQQQSVLEYVKSQENGLFMQDCDTAYYDTSTYYERNIGGFPANERITLRQDGEIVYWGEKFTPEEISHVPDLGAFISSLDMTALVPPHTENYEQMQVYRRFAFGKYVKNEGTVYGVVRVHWQLLQQVNRDQYIYYDDLYYLVMPDGTYQIMEIEELITYIGEDNILSTFYEYNVGERWWYW